MFRTCQAIRSITTSNGKTISVAFVTKTDAWERTFLAASTQNDFVAVAEKYKDSLKPETVKVAMKRVVYKQQERWCLIYIFQGGRAFEHQ
ncbi:hypothetical protein FOPE_10918 [Fonsecaea pedrosoi]|nr:hypothetical protein FOPE_10918 [Fonsecaea pedrosoi]